MTRPDVDAPESTNAWKQFWERGAWWKALLLAAGYYALYQLASLALFPLAPMFADSTGAVYVLFFYALPIFLGGVILVIFGLSVGWLRSTFAPQPVRGRGWMWIAVVVVLLFNVLRFAATDYAELGAGVVIAWLLTGLLIGFAEELLTRGYVVRIMRAAGHREIVVAVVSAAIFAALHVGNLLTGQALVPTLIQLAYTFAFGICMYLALRVTGSIVWPILLHATTDPSISMLGLAPTAGSLTAIAGLGNIAVIIVGLLAVAFIRDQRGAPAQT